MENNKLFLRKKEDKIIIIVCHCTWYLYNFRYELLKEFNKKGYKLILLSPLDKYHKKIKRFFVKSNRLLLFRGSENPILEIITIFNLLFLYIKYRPIMIHHFSIKPSIYGGIAARLIGIKYVINHITGLGPSFFSNRIKINLFNKILKPFYRFSFNYSKAINIFHNNSDKETLINKKLTSIKKSVVIKGSGVNTNYFNIKSKKMIFNQRVRILFPARVIKEKGVIELVNACKELWESDYKFTLCIAGEIDKKNNSCLDNKELFLLQKNKNIEFLGMSENILEVYKTIDIVILPSWREGLSKSILEAASMSLPIITSNVPGCNDIIKDKFSGILVKPRSTVQLKKAIKFFLENPSLAIKYGEKARETVLAEFTDKIINNQIISLYEKLLE